VWSRGSNSSLRRNRVSRSSRRTRGSSGDSLNTSKTCCGPAKSPSSRPGWTATSLKLAPTLTAKRPCGRPGLEADNKTDVQGGRDWRVEEARGTVEATFRERTLSMQRQIDALQARLQELQRAAQRSAEPAVLPQTPPTASKQRSASVQAVQTQPKVTMRTLSDGFRIDAFPTIASPQVGRPLVAGPFTKMALPVPRAWQSPFQGRCNVGRHARTVSHNTRRDLQIPEAPGSALSAALISAQHKWPRHRQQPPIRNDRDTPLSPTMPTQHLVLTPRGLGHGAVPPKPTEGGPSCLPTAGAALGPTLAALPGSRSGLLVHL